MGRHFCKYFAIQLDITTVEGGNKRRVADSILPGTCRDTLYPQFAPFSLFAFAVSIGVLPRFMDPTNCDTETVFRPSTITFRVSQKIFVLHRREGKFYKRGLEIK